MENGGGGGEVKWLHVRHKRRPLGSYGSTRRHCRVLCGVPWDLPSGHEGSTPALYFAHAFYQVPRPPSPLMDPSSMVTKLQKRGSLLV
ncbi:hypothetical protein TNCT_523401 [Trichonephila clavata]|uniref:Uncharacterized protein n=1 Tax=Trichonephila clavata TaxID=2740835 RepID=A0A8X6J8W3_TRICU|nr:hypothetical protein TNCT_523401 [Trichonephila clavata]